MQKRLFVAIDMPDAVQRALADLDPHIPGVRWTEASQMHLTLGFFGHLNEDNAGPARSDLALREKLRAIEFGAFFLPIRGIGTFPPKGAPKIVWIGVGKAHPHLFQIHKRVTEAALSVGIEPELRSWHPHITLARCRDVSWQSIKNFLRENAGVDLGLIRVEAFHLFCSELTPAGPIHTCEMTIRATAA